MKTTKTAKLQALQHLSPGSSLAYTKLMDELWTDGSVISHRVLLQLLRLVDFWETFSAQNSTKSGQTAQKPSRPSPQRVFQRHLKLSFSKKYQDASQHL